MLQLFAVTIIVLLSIAGVASLIPISVLAQTSFPTNTTINSSAGIPRPEPAIKLDTTYDNGIIIIVFRPTPPLPLPPDDCKACGSELMKPDVKGLATIKANPNSLLLITQIPEGMLLNKVLANQSIQQGSLDLSMNTSNITR